MEKFRNLTYLEQQLEEYNRLERDRMEVSIQVGGKRSMIIIEEVWRGENL